MNILLVFANYSQEKQQHPNEFPLGLGYIGAILKREGNQVSIADLSVNTPSRKELGRLIKTVKPDILGISAMTENYSQVLNIVQIAREAVSNIYIILGGCHATFKYEEVLKEIPEIDLIVIGEGEITICEIVNEIKKSDKPKLEKINGIAYRKLDKILLTPTRDKIKNLDELPYPDFDLLIHPKIEEYFDKDTRRLPILTSRGCPYECIFCSTSVMHGKEYRARSPKNVVDEMEYMIKKYKLNGINIVDDMFTLNVERTKKICQEIIDRNLNISWGCLSRVDSVTPELLKIMKKAGCNGIFYGIESLNNDVLKKIKKGYKYHQIKQAIEWTIKEDLDVDASFILGLPGENFESLMMIPAFVRETGINRRVLTNMLQLLPGSELYRNLEYYGIQKKDDTFQHWTQIRSYFNELSKQDILKVLFEIKYELYENKNGDEGLFEIIKPKIELTQELTMDNLL